MISNLASSSLMRRSWKRKWNPDCAKKSALAGGLKFVYTVWRRPNDWEQVPTACTRLIFLAHSFIFPFFVQTSNTRVAVERDNLIIWADENMGNWNSWIYLFPPYLAVPSPGRTSSEPLGCAELVPPVFFWGKMLDSLSSTFFRRETGRRARYWI